MADAFVKALFTRGTFPIPDAVMAEVSMVTAVKTAVLASTGTSWNHYVPPTEVALLPETLIEVAFVRTSFALPDAVYAEKAMTTAVKNNVLATTGVSFSRYISPFKVALNNQSGALQALANDSFLLVDALNSFGGPPNYTISFSDNYNFLADSAKLLYFVTLAISDNLFNLADSLAIAIGFPVPAFDSMQFNWADNVVTFIQGVIKITKADQITLSDSFQKIVGTVPIFLTTSDNMNLLQDAFKLRNAILFAFGDTLVLSDFEKAQLSTFLKLTDAFNTLVDAFNLKFSRSSPFSDAMSLSDSATTFLIGWLTTTASDSISLQDAVLVALGVAYSNSAIQNIRRYLNDLN